MKRLSLFLALMISVSSGSLHAGEEDDLAKRGIPGRMRTGGEPRIFEDEEEVPTGIDANALLLSVRLYPAYLMLPREFFEDTPVDLLLAFPLSSSHPFSHTATKHFLIGEKLSGAETPRLQRVASYHFYQSHICFIKSALEESTSFASKIKFYIYAIRSLGWSAQMHPDANTQTYLNNSIYALREKYKVIFFKKIISIRVKQYFKELTDAS